MISQSLEGPIDFIELIRRWAVLDSFVGLDLGFDSTRVSSPLAHLNEVLDFGLQITRGLNQYSVLKGVPFIGGLSELALQFELAALFLLGVLELPIEHVFCDFLHV